MDDLLNKSTSDNQQLFTDILKKFNTNTLKVGNVRCIKDKTLRTDVIVVSGTSPALNFLQIPQTSTHSLNLVDRLFYIFFKPISEQYFVIHLNVVSSCELIYRISVSNIFKEFKITSTWIQFPFFTNEAGSILVTKENCPSDCKIDISVKTKWTLLALDLAYILSIYLNKRFIYLKSIQLCANLLVKNLFTSDIRFNPLISSDIAVKENLYVKGIFPLPFEFRVALPNGKKWQDEFDFVCFPNIDNITAFDHVLSNSLSTLKKKKAKSISVHKKLEKDIEEKPAKNVRNVTVERKVAKLSEKKPQTDSLISNSTKQQFHPRTFSVHHDSSGEVHIFTRENQKLFIHRDVANSDYKKFNLQKYANNIIEQKEQHNSTFLDKVDSLLILHAIIGFGGITTSEVCLSTKYNSVIYPSFALIIIMDINTKEQTFLYGHTNKVSALAILEVNNLLASAQTDWNGPVRLWCLLSKKCIVAIKASISFVNCLEFSPNGTYLCGVGKDFTNKITVILWDIKNVQTTRTVSVLASVCSKVDIIRMRVAFFDDSKMVSCGSGNIQLWKLRDHNLHPYSILLGEHTTKTFTDCRFLSNYPTDKTVNYYSVFVTDRNGNVHTIDLSSLRIVLSKNLSEIGQYVKGEKYKVSKKLDAIKNSSGLSENSSLYSQNISINCLKITECVCIVGCSNGYLKAFPLNFSHLLLKAEHGDAITAVDISLPSGKIMSSTAEGSIGILDIRSKKYTTLIRSHIAKILSISCDAEVTYLASVSADHTIRVWNILTFQQIYEYYTSDSSPSTISCHPREPVFSCGFTDGSIAVFSTVTLSMILNLRQHRGKIVGLVYSRDGGFMFSACSYGQLVMYNVNSNYVVTKILTNTVMLGDEHTPDALTINDNNTLLASAGPNKFSVSVFRILDLQVEIEINLPRPKEKISDLSSLESVLRIQFQPGTSNNIYVLTSLNNIYKFNTSQGILLSELNNIHHGVCTALEMSSRCLFTAGDSIIKVWDNTLQPNSKPQNFIGHLEPIHKLLFISQTNQLISVGEAIFIWKVKTKNEEF